MRTSANDSDPVVVFARRYMAPLAIAGSVLVIAFCAWLLSL